MHFIDVCIQSWLVANIYSRCFNCNGNCNIIPENKEKNREHEHNLYVI